MAITLTVCGDAPVRLPELLDLFAREQRADDEVKRTFEIVSLLCGGAARASELNDVANSVSAGHVNSSIASAKRILVGDLNMRLFLTIFQVYRVGTSNVPRSFETTPWSGTYGAANAFSCAHAHAHAHAHARFPFNNTQVLALTSAPRAASASAPRR